MKLKLDENLPHDLAGHGHGVETVTDEGLAGSHDTVVLRAATDEDRVLLTLDRGFGDVRSYPPGTHPGIVVLRSIRQDPDTIIGLVGRVLDLGELDDLRGSIGVVEPERIRDRNGPTAKAFHDSRPRSGTCAAVG